MVLILSENSNRSRQVLREVERAVATDTVVIPSRIEAIDPSCVMSYRPAIAADALDQVTTIATAES